MAAQLTISLVAYNEEKHIEDTIKSILNQTYRDYIFRIYNHASTDSTGAIADHFAKLDPRVQVVHLPVNEGMKTHHRVISEADTPYWMGAAGHDLYDPRYLEACIQPLLQDPNTVLSYSRAAFFKANQATGLIHGNFDTLGMDPLSRSLVVGYGLVYAYQSYGIYRLSALRNLTRNTCVGYDHVLLTELALFGSFAEVPETLFFMRQLEDHGDPDAYKKKHHSRDAQDGHLQFQRTAQAYMAIADRIDDHLDRDLMKLAYFTQALIRHRNILGMYDRSVHSFLSTAEMQDVSQEMQALVRLLESRFKQIELTAAPNASSKPVGAVKIAGEGVVGKDLTEIQKDSEFEVRLKELIQTARPRSIIETGTYLGKGTTRVVAEALREAGLTDTTFFSIECNPNHHNQARANLAERKLASYVRLMLGLSVPRRLLPTVEQIHEHSVTNVSDKDIFVDHQAPVRAATYFKETDFPNADDDLLGRCIDAAGGQPDILILDSGGHMGNVEFNYVLQKLRHGCYFVLDDIRHLKHHQSFAQMQRDSRFRILTVSDEKFGFCIARFEPATADGRLDNAAEEGKPGPARNTIGSEAASRKVEHTVKAHSVGTMQPRSILWVRTDSIGDNVLASSMLRPLRERFPDSKIVVVCQQHIAELYEACPYIDQIIAFDRARAYADGAYRAGIIEQIRAATPDLALNPVFSREPLTDLLTLECGAPVTVACEGDFANGMTSDLRDKFDPLYTHLLKNVATRRLELDRHRDFLSAIGIEQARLELEAWVSEEDVAFADAFLEENGLDPAKTIALFPGAQHHYRIYQSYVQALSHFSDFKILILGSAGDVELAAKIAADMPGRTVVAAGKTSLRQLAALIGRCRLFVGSESAGAHLACAVGTPNVIVLGGGHFGRFMPYSPLTSAVCLPLECYGCDWSCRYQQAHCVSGIAPEVLEAAIASALGAKSDRPRVFVQGTSLWAPGANRPRWAAAEGLIDASLVEVIPVGTVPVSARLLWEAAKLRAEGDLEGASENTRKARLCAANSQIEDESVIERALVLNGKGEAAYADGNPEDAIACFGEALDLVPNFAIAHNNLAVAHFANGGLEAAVQSLEMALDLDPYDRDIVINSGRMLKALGLDDVSTIYERYLNRMGDDEEIEALLQGESKHKATGAAGHEVMVSAIVSTYNADKFIRGCLEDLEAQTIADRMEIIVVDTGSPQREGDIVRELQQKYGNIQYIRTEHRETVYQAWNRGIRAARGKYITNANTDDRHRRDGIELLVNALERDPSKVLAYGDSIVTIKEGETFDNCTVHGYLRWPDFDQTTMLDFCYMGPHPVWRKSLHDELGYFDEKYQCAADYEFWLRVAQNHAFVHVRELIGLYWLNEGTVSRKGDLPIREAQEIISAYRPKYAALAQYASHAQRPLKILMVTHTFLPLSRAGVEMYVAQLAKALQAAGHTVHVYHPVIDSAAQGSRLAVDDQDGIKVHRLITKPCPTTFHYSDGDVEEIFGKLIEREGFDVVHFHHLMNSPLSLVGVAKAKCIARLSIHDHWFICPRIHLVDWANRICSGPETLDKCTECVLHSLPESQRQEKYASVRLALSQRKAEFEKLMSRAGSASFPSKYLLDKYKQHLVFQDGTVAQLGMPVPAVTHGRVARNDSVTFVFIGNIYPVKNTLSLAQTFSRLKQNARLLIWGAAIPGQYFDEIRSLVDEDPRIRLMGPYESGQLGAILAEADVVVVPSLIETYSLTVREALSHGVPVFAANVGALPEVVRHLANGVLFNPTDPTELLGWMEKAIEEPEFLASLRKESTPIRNITEDAQQWASCYKQEIWKDRGPTALVGGEEIVGSTTHDVAYQNWLKKHSMQEIDGQLLAERMVLKWRVKPVVHFVMRLDAGNESMLADTIDSLGRQMYQQWRLTVVADFAAPSPIFSELDILRWVQVDSHADAANAINAAASQGASDWLCFISPGTILTPQFLITCADYINIRPDWKLIYTDEDEIDGNGVRSNPKFKPDFNLDLLRSTPYLGMYLVEKTTFMEVGGYSELLGAESYDLALRVLDRYGEVAMGHVTDVLWHAQRGSSERIVDESAMAALSEHLRRSNVEAEVQSGYVEGTYRVEYRHATQPFVTIIIPNKDKLEFLQPCLESLLGKTTYPNYEVIIVDNQSEDPDVLDYYEELKNANPERIRILRYDAAFNFSAMNNMAAREARGDFLLLLNNDTEVVQPTWLERLLNHGLRSDVGVVGARCVYPETGKIQHAGVVLGMGPHGVADHPFNGQFDISEPGYMNRALVDQNYSAVTAACMLVSKAAWEAAGGMDENELQVLFNDVDLCLKIGKAGYKVVWTPYATVVHHGSTSLKEESVDLMKLALGVERAKRERSMMIRRWLPVLANDPAYNRQFSLQPPGYGVEGTVVIDWDTNFHDRPRILASPLSGGSGEYRVIGPFRALSRAGLAQCDVIQMSEMFKTRVLTSVELERAKPDTLVLQTAIDNTQIEALELYKQFNADVLRVFTLDDLLTQVPKQNSFYRYSYKDSKPRLRKALALCDRAIVTTEPLAELCRSMIGDVRLIPNRLERALWGDLKSLRRQGRKPRVGWAGAQQHAGDLALMADVVRATAQEVDWVFFGMCPEELRPYVREFHDFVLSFYDYPAKLASLNLDLAVAPLEINPFNEAKSNLRLLEYGMMGWPVVCTDIYPYQDAPVRRVANDPQAWVDAIRERIHDLDAAEREGDQLKSWVLKQFVLEDHLDQWMQALVR